ncbi:MAG: hypothetical protein WCG00_12380 [Hyphomicrobiales bacterium]
MPAFQALRFFAFERLLERGQFGEGRIGIRRLVARPRSRAMRLGIILLALGALDLVAAIAARTSAEIAAAAGRTGTATGLARLAEAWFVERRLVESGLGCRMRRRLAGAFRALGLKTLGLAFRPLLTFVAVRTPVTRRSILALFAGSAFGGRGRCRCAFGRRCRLLRARRAASILAPNSYASRSSLPLLNARTRRTAWPHLLKNDKPHRTTHERTANDY